MKRVLLVIGLFLLMVPTVGCAMGREVLSPGIWYQNISRQDIKIVKIRWVKSFPLVENLGPGRNSIQSFPLSHPQDFYGEVYILWENAIGKRFEKQFLFTEKDLPLSDIGNKDINDYVVLEFTQSGMQYYTHNAPNAAERIRKASRFMKQIRDARY